MTTIDPPCLLYEDAHLLVVCKPAGWNTHAPAPFAGEGIYDWLRHREPRWAGLAIMHRLDKETSGVLVFAKTALASKSLTEQFSQRCVQKKYLLLAATPPKHPVLRVESTLVRLGNRYVSRPGGAGEQAITEFRVLEADSHGRVWVEARPLTGRTHQIRVHASENGFPILGDTLYGGAAAERVCLHAAELRLRHPESGEALVLTAPVSGPEPFGEAATALRRAIIDADTNAWRLINGGGDPGGVPGRCLDRWSSWLLASTDGQTEAGLDSLGRVVTPVGVRGVYRKTLRRSVRGVGSEAASPTLVFGDPAPDRFTVCENGVRYEVSFSEGYSVGLFLDQRDNRRRLLVNHVGADFPAFPAGAGGAEVLNVFAYTCAFSVCAALAGARTTSLDLSKKYLEWGRRNFLLNDVYPAAHDFIFGDAFDWLRRLGKKGRRFGVVLLDPPTFSTSKTGGCWQAERDYARLIATALPLVQTGGLLFASANTAQLAPEVFVEQAATAIRAGGRRVLRQLYVPQPPDFPISRTEPAYLKTLWLRLD